MEVMNNYQFLKKNNKKKGHVQSCFIIMWFTHKNRPMTKRNNNQKTGQIDPWVYDSITN